MLCGAGNQEPVEILVDDNSREASGVSYVHSSGRFYIEVRPRLPQTHCEVVAEQQSKL